MSAYSQFLSNYVAAWNRQDVEAMISFYTEDVVYIDHAVGVKLNRTTVRTFLKSFIGRYSDGFKVTPHHVCQDPSSEKLAYEWQVTGTSKTGVKMSIRGISMMQMRGDKISRNVDYWNRADSPRALVEAKEGQS